MNKFYIITNLLKDKTLETTHRIKHYIEEHGKECVLATPERILPEGTDCVLVLGGDGTLIRAARDMHAYDVPLLGINMGTLGYLTQMGRDGDPKELLDALLEDRYEIHERMMLRGRVFHNDECIAEDIALNDIVLTREGELRVLKFELYVDGQFLTEYSADGMIVSTPTGSTAYNLSAGGPIAQPDGEMIILTPVCPHTLTSRTIVLGPNCKVRIRIPMKSRGYRMVSFDGDTQVSLDRGDYYEIEKADMVTRVVKLDSKSFLDILKHKMYEA